jgi:tetratricopeptide (TPR) repeat protein
MTVDYRNERLILKKSIESNLVDSFMSMINEAEIQYHNDNDTQKATQTFQGIAKLAESKKIYSAQAIALAMTARCFSHKYAETKQDTFFDQATQLYNEASLKASESHSKDIQAQVFALWAELYFLNPKKPDNILNGQNLINQAISRAPAEPIIYCVLGPMLLNLGQTGAASKVLDQALMLDPSSWDALWAKYKLAKLASNQTAMKNIQAQLKYYYPDSPEVDALSQPNSQAGSSPAQVAPQTTTTTTPKPIAKPTARTTTSKSTSQKPTVKPKPAAKKSVPAKPAAKKK